MASGSVRRRCGGLAGTVTPPRPACRQAGGGRSEAEHSSAANHAGVCKRCGEQTTRQPLVSEVNDADCG